MMFLRRVWWCTSVFQASRQLRQRDCSEFKNCLCYIARPCRMRADKHKQIIMSLQSDVNIAVMFLRPFVLCLFVVLCFYFPQRLEVPGSASSFNDSVSKCLCATLPIHKCHIRQRSSSDVFPSYYITWIWFWVQIWRNCVKIFIWVWVI